MKEILCGTLKFFAFFWGAGGIFYLAGEYAGLLALAVGAYIVWDRRWPPHLGGTRARDNPSWPHGIGEDP